LIISNDISGAQPAGLCGNLLLSAPKPAQQVYTSLTTTINGSSFTSPDINPFWKNIDRMMFATILQNRQFEKKTPNNAGAMQVETNCAVYRFSIAPLVVRMSLD
jgi:hypothetical protein